MNNLWSYCGLVDAKIRASDKDLPVPKGYYYEANVGANAYDNKLRNMRLPREVTADVV